MTQSYELWICRYLRYYLIKGVHIRGYVRASCIGFSVLINDDMPKPQNNIKVIETRKTFMFFTQKLIDNCDQP